MLAKFLRFSQIMVILILLAWTMFEVGSAQGMEVSVLVKDINPGGGDSSPDHLTDVNGTLFFSADNGANGRELWKSDGTAAGTVLVKDFPPAPFNGDPSPSNLTNVNGTLFFSAYDGINGWELWKSDGTTAGTVLVKDIHPGSNGSFPDHLTDVNGTLFFSASNGANGWELWKSDGTDAGTILVEDINPGGNNSYPENLTNVNGALFFSANDGINGRGRELWKSDGTTAGTVLVKDVRPGGSGSYPENLTNVNGTLFFSADDGINGRELWKSDGTATGTILVKDIRPGSVTSSLDSLTNVNGTLFFSANDGINGVELWKSNGTTAGTIMVKDNYPGSSPSGPQNLTNVNGTLFFRASDGINSVELWKSDGTAVGTVLVKDIFSGRLGSYPFSLTNVNGTLFFSANDGPGGRELWKSDGTAVGTVPVRGIDSGSTPWSPDRLTNVNGTLFFSADDGVHGVELWTIEVGNPTKSPLVFIPGIAGSYLVDQNNGNKELWPGIFTSQLPLSLYPEDNPLSGIIATDVIDSVLGHQVYGPLIERLENEGYRVYEVDNKPERRTTQGCDYNNQKDQQPNLFIFAYDWRKDNAANAAVLKDYMGCIQQFYPNQPVNIVAHSMGGLLARRYILDNPNTHRVSRLITIGSPWLGAPKTSYTLETGDFVPFVTNTTIKRIIGSFPGAHQLLPSQAYHELGGGPIIEEAGWDFDGDGQANEEGYSYNDFIKVMDTRYGRSGFLPGTTGQIFHNYTTSQGNQDDWRNDATNVKYYHLVGIEERNKTIGRLRAVHKFYCTPIIPLICRFKDNLEIIPTLGDGTVPRLSAERIGAGKNYNAPTAQLFYFFNGSGGNTSNSVEHTDLAHNPAVLSKVVELLNQSEQTNISINSLATGPTYVAQPANYLKIIGGESVIVSDSFGNSTAPITGTINGRGQVPNVATYVLGDQAAMIIMPTNGTYTVTFQTSNEPMAIELTVGTGTSPTQAIRYQDLTLPGGKTAKLLFTPQGVDPLRYDNDGDGTFETQVTPTVKVSGTMAQDTEPPIINISASTQQTYTVVTIQATDSGSGVKNIFYSVDGIHFQTYTSPLQLNPSQTPRLYIFADDNVANRSSAVEYNLNRSQDIYLPIIQKN